jgi:hypothetical protein
MCESCGKWPAKGGHRLCRACLGKILSQPAPIREEPTGYQYPKRKK